MSACDGCLRRAALLGLLAPWVERARKPNRRRLPEVLALSDDELVEALCGDKRAEVDRPLARFDPANARARAEAAGIEVVCRHAAALSACAGPRRDAPAALYLIGDGALLERAGSASGAVAIVGSRRASSYGIEMARSTRARPGGVRRDGRQRDGLRRRRRRAQRGAGGPRTDGRGDAGRSGRRLPARQATPARAASDLRSRRVRDAAGDAPVPLVLSGSQPDHGRRSPG